MTDWSLGSASDLAQTIRNALVKFEINLCSLRNMFIILIFSFAHLGDTTGVLARQW